MRFEEILIGGTPAVVLIAWAVEFLKKKTSATIAGFVVEHEKAWAAGLALVAVVVAYLVDPTRFGGPGWKGWAAALATFLPVAFGAGLSHDKLPFFKSAPKEASLPRIVPLLLVAVLLLSGCSSIDGEYARQNEENRRLAERALSQYHDEDKALSESDRARWARFWAEWRKTNEEALK